MKRSTSRILATGTGSRPRSPESQEMMLASLAEPASLAELASRAAGARLATRELWRRPG